MSELDNNLESTRQELCRARARLGHEEGRWHCREQELLSRLEESRGREKRLDDQKHNLEVCLADATQQIQELKVINTKLVKLVCTILNFASAC